MSGRSLALGQYYPGESPLHRLDPRVKLVLTMLMVLSLFAVDDLGVLLMTAVIVPALAAIAGLPMLWVMRGLRPLLFILGFTFFAHAFFTPGPLLAALGPVTVTTAGLRGALFFSLRLALVILISSFITLTTTPVKLTEAIESLFGPLKKVRFPAHEIALMMTIALRFIPTLLAEAETIIMAQKARGADFESGNIVRRARSFVPVLIPLFVSAFRRADELAVAMESRGYAGGEGRTRLHELVIRPADLVWLGVGILVVLGLLGTSWLT